MKTYIIYLLIIIIFVALACSGEDEEQIIPAHQIPDELIGSWRFEDSENWPGQFYHKIFDKSNATIGDYESYWIADVPQNGGMTIIAAEKGTYSTTTIEIHAVPSTFGTEQIMTQHMEFYDTTVWYYPGDTQFNIFEYESKFGYVLKDSILILKFDINDDGDYNDNGEALEFLKEDK